MHKATADLCDRYSTQLRVASPVFNDYGGKLVFEGPVSTVKVRDDNSLVRAALQETGEGRVLVIDGGGSTRCALVGDRLAELACGNGWAGIVVYGCVRDTEALARIAIGVKAIAANPRKSVKRGRGQREVPIRLADIEVRRGDYLYADRDGIVVATGPLA